MACRQSTDSTIVKSNSNPGSANVSEAENELNGTWKQSCGGDLDSSGAVKNFNTTEATYSDSKVNGKSTIYLDSECKDKALLMELTGVMDSGKILMQPAGAKNFDVTVSEMQITIFNSKTLDAYNGKSGGSAVCGGGWTLGKNRKILKATCGADDETFKNSFEKLYDIYKIEGDSLYTGFNDEKDPTTDGSSPERRPKIFEKRAWTK
jgi:hypothetical protein